MIDLTKIFYFVFGALTIAGGVMGYVKAGSMASLFAGGISGLLLLVAGWLILSAKVQPGLILGLILCIALAGRFLPAFIKTQKFMPAGMVGILGVIGIVLTILAFVKK